ncbi:MAG: lysylphosphatidylglycerol synthase transmembrane domain-containing protein [Planctomycetota bacterium]
MADAVGAPGGDAAPDPRPDSRLGRRLLVAVVLGLAVYAALALWADLDGLGAALAAIPWWAPVAACALSLVNYAVRFPRWQRYLTITGSRVRGAESARIYLAGLALTVSPGKVGEALKSWLLRDADGTPLATSAPIVLAERVTDLLGFLVLIGLTARAGEHAWIALATLGLAAAVLLLVASRRVAHAVTEVAGRLPVVGARAAQLEEALDSAQRLLAPRELPIATLLAALGWFCECVGCWILVQSVLPADAPASTALGLAGVTYAFALSAVAGAVVVIAPGGLGVTEGLLTGLLEGGYRAAAVAATPARATALSVTLVARLCTLWFAMGVGLIALQLQRRARTRAE